MAASQTSRPYTINNPGGLVAIGEGLWGVEDDVPGLKGAARRMVIVRRGDGSLLFYNAVPVPDVTLDAIRALGRPAQLLCPNQFHTLDAAAFAERLGVTMLGPPATRERLSACRPVDDLGDPSIEPVTVDGFKTHEVALLVRGKTLVTADVVTNAPHVGGFTGLLMRAVGFTGPTPRLPPPVRWRVMRDKPAVRALLERLAARPGLDCLVPSHGTVFHGDVSAALRAIAATI